MLAALLVLCVRKKKTRNICSCRAFLVEIFQEVSRHLIRTSSHDLLGRGEAEGPFSSLHKEYWTLFSCVDGPGKGRTPGNQSSFGGT